MSVHTLAGNLIGDIYTPDSQTQNAGKFAVAVSYTVRQIKERSENRGKTSAE